MLILKERDRIALAAFDSKNREYLTVVGTGKNRHLEVKHVGRLKRCAGVLGIGKCSLRAVSKYIASEFERVQIPSNRTIVPLKDDDPLCQGVKKLMAVLEKKFNVNPDVYTVSSRLNWKEVAHYRLICIVRGEIDLSENLMTQDPDDIQEDAFSSFKYQANQ